MALISAGEVNESRLREGSYKGRDDEYELD
jgi:hypothetical protein